MVSSIYINITVCSYKLCLLATHWKAKILSFIPSFIEMWWISNMIILYAYYLEITFNWSASGFCLEKRPAGLPQEISEVSQHTVVQGKQTCERAGELAHSMHPCQKYFPRDPVWLFPVPKYTRGGLSKLDYGHRKCKFEQIGHKEPSPLSVVSLLQLLIICTTLPSVALQVFLNLPTLKYWSCIFEWCITPDIPL